MAGPLTLDAFLPYRLSFTSNMVSERIAGIYQALFGLDIPQWRLIAVLAEEDGISQAAIGARTRMDKVTVSRAAIALVDRALVSRRPNAADRRSRLLGLTPAGRELYEVVAPKALALEAEIVAGFSTREIDQLVTLLRRIDTAVGSLPKGS